MILRARADSLKLVVGENGWSLIAETDEGDTIVLNIHGVAHQFVDSDGFRGLLIWHYDGHLARRSLAVEVNRHA